nr:hypothetical protein HAGR004_40880 [Bdellovibrio sp. HAGR004]
MKETQHRSQAYIEKMVRWLWPVLRFVFRLEVTGTEHLKQQACLLVSNHNSGAVIESHSLVSLMVLQKIRAFGLNHQALFKIPIVAKHFRKIGAISASREATQEALKEGAPVLIFPGGNRQAFRPLKMRHQHSFPWAKGWAEIAVQEKVPVVPIKFIGSHWVNPILFTSKTLSTLLVLPRLLKVTWFPVSVSQILAAFLVGSLGFTSGVSGVACLLMIYFAFVFTPLIPVVPARIRIKIYPALIPDKDFKTSAELIEVMNTLMDHQDYPAGTKQKYALNGVERFMLYNVSEKVPYNSQFIFDFEGTLNKEKILQVTQTWLTETPVLRSVIEESFYRPQRYIYKKVWFKAENIVEFSDSLDDQQRDQFCYRPFHLAFEPAVRFLVQSDGRKHRMIFSCHHSLMDGAGQAFAFEIWAKLYKGLEYPQAFKNVQSFYYRDLRKTLGLKKFCQLLFTNLRPSPRRSVKGVACLNTLPDIGDRRVSSVTAFLDMKNSRRIDYTGVVIEAFDSTLKAIGDSEKPLFVIIPVGLRWTLRVRDSLQNILVSSVLFLKREKLKDPSWQQDVHKKLAQDPIELNQKFLFGVLPLCSLSPAGRLRKRFSQMDSVKSSQSSSLLFVQAPIPQTYSLPHDWENVFISARGTLLKSPGVGVIVTGKKSHQTVTVEYIPSLVDENHARKLLAEITQRIHQTI